MAARQKDAQAASLSQRANELLAAGDYQGAIELYQKALSLTPDDEDLHYNLGLAYGKAGSITNAENHYREALRLLPDYPEVKNNLGNLLLNSGRIAEAEVLLTEAINLEPRYAIAHNNLGIVRQRQHRLAEALESFQNVVRYDSNYWEGHFNLGKACLLAGDKTNAILELREALRLNPGFVPAENSLKKALEREAVQAISRPKGDNATQ